ncbi:DMT family transporter [Gammaproteobacteria bacterium]|nr:DMT family transporter [Gammaproteobacteria bacterium]|tara:strand:+ start:822 stop:1697 length:876 start_codon:yes stop_codon:yes gene_type:complete
MKLRNFCELLLLSAIWGSSFLFLRIASPAFGPIFLIEMRVLSGLLVLLPVFFVMRKYQEFKLHWKMILLVSLLNMAIPFCFFAYSALNMGAGLLSIMNATVPIFTAMVGFLYFRQRLSQLGFAGLVVGLLGVAILMSESRAESGITSDLAIPAALFASILYGIAINLAAHKLQGVSGITITTGSLFFSSAILLPLAMRSRPEVIPEGVIWLSVLTLGIVCTGFGYVLFYRLIAEIGSQRAITTTYLIPLFSIFWGSLFLGETLTVAMFLGGATVLLGVALTTGRSSQIPSE